MNLTRFSLAGLAVALVGAAARDAAADPLTISTATTTPVVTSNASNGSAGDVTITSGGSITVTAGQTAVTVDSSNNVTNGGVIATNDADNVTGILLQGGFAGDITNNGAINLLESYTQTDTDSDGDLDGLLAIGTNRNGIWLQAGPAFTGDILNAGSITIEGQNSAAIRLDAQLVGDLIINRNTSTIVTGDNGVGVAINGGASGGVDGDVRLSGNLTVRGEN
jgi:hypothetical protein